MANSATVCTTSEKVHEMKLVRSDTQIMRVILKSFSVYPIESALVVFSTIAAGFAESLGLLTFLPLLQIGIGGGLGAVVAEPEVSVGAAEQFFIQVFEFIGVEPTIPVLLLIIFVTTVFKSAGMFLTRSYIGIVSARVATNLRINMIKALLRTSWRYFVSQSTGRLSNAVSTEAQRASNTYLAAWNMAAAAIQIALFLVVSAAVSFEVLLLGCAAGVCINLMLHWTVKMARSAGRDETDRMNSLISRLTDNIMGIKPLKAMGLEKRILPLLEHDTQGLRSAQKRQAYAAAAQQNVPQPVMVGLMALGGWYALTYTSADLSHLAVVALFFSRMVSRITEFQKFYQMLNVSISAYDSINQATQEAEEAVDNGDATGLTPELKDKILLDDVVFSYDGNRPILDHVTLEIQANKMTALIGPSGSGKTTIADLITGLISPNGGKVLIDGLDMSVINREKWRSCIGYVPQELYLFHDTILSNVTLKDPEISREMVWKALERSGAADFLRKLPEGLDTIIGERGSRLSGGQRQRLMIARALVREPRLLVLDEATTALDPETERAICQTVKSLSHDLTIIAISHQKAVKDFADKVIDVSLIARKDP